MLSRKSADFFCSLFGWHLRTDAQCLQTAAEGLLTDSFCTAVPLQLLVLYKRSQSKRHIPEVQKHSVHIHLTSVRRHWASVHRRYYHLMASSSALVYMDGNITGKIAVQQKSQKEWVSGHTPTIVLSWPYMTNEHFLGKVMQRLNQYLFNSHNLIEWLIPEAAKDE